MFYRRLYIYIDIYIYIYIYNTNVTIEYCGLTISNLFTSLDIIFTICPILAYCILS